MAGIPEEDAGAAVRFRFLRLGICTEHALAILFFAVFLSH